MKTVTPDSRRPPSGVPVEDEQLGPSLAMVMDSDWLSERAKRLKAHGKRVARYMNGRRLGLMNRHRRRRKVFSDRGEQWHSTDECAADLDCSICSVRQCLSGAGRCKGRRLRWEAEEFPELRVPQKNVNVIRLSDGARFESIADATGMPVEIRKMNRKAYKRLHTALVRAIENERPFMGSLWRYAHEESISRAS